MPSIRLSIFVISYRRLAMLQKCCASILRELPPGAELVVVVNGEDLPTERWLRTQRDSRLRWYTRDRTDRSQLRNEAWQTCRGQIIHFLDDDLEVPGGIFSRLLQAFDENAKLAIVGGPNLTPPESPVFEKICGELLATPIVCPLVWRRYRKTPPTEKLSAEYFLIGCNFAVRRDAIPPSVRFERFISNEENVFHFECKKAGLETRILPEMFVFHYRRSSLISFLKQIHSYGRGRGLQYWFYPQSNRMVFLLPAVWICCWPFLPWQAWVFYTGALGLGGILSSRFIRFKPWYWAWVPFLGVLLHWSYGAGLIRSLVAEAWALVRVPRLKQRLGYSET